jgi:hypothetical protein
MVFMRSNQVADTEARLTRGASACISNHPGVADFAGMDTDPDEFGTRWHYGPPQIRQQGPTVDSTGDNTLGFN